MMRLPMPGCAVAGKVKQKTNEKSQGKEKDDHIDIYVRK
jgi:hypothetical protein